MKPPGAVNRVSKNKGGKAMTERNYTTILIQF
jgi:hypothetical protein